MTLKEKFEKVPILYEGAIGRLEYDEFKNASIKCEKIADEFAIEFSKYVLSQIYNMTHGNKAGISIEELLEIYKKEKGV
ncbi:hypothetical protein UFOVP54_217 [uncultured Caudovirales phage]|uniref:Uncharacterized protein n=1 Tax=uncultured Caudovirales phage TaxID=2100421 RepID=A0A6J5KXF4_9CAUD|nr:hypothetical protein UFOVP54_217 [uncultured Caudovirales phage]